MVSANFTIATLTLAVSLWGQTKRFSPGVPRG